MKFLLRKKKIKEWVKNLLFDNKYVKVDCRVSFTLKRLIE